MGIARLIGQAFIAAFITMIFIYFIKKLAGGKGIPVVSAVADGV